MCYHLNMSETQKPLHPTLRAATEEVEYRCLWEEEIAGMMLPFSGKVYNNFKQAHEEAERRRRFAYSFYRVCIECRLKPDSDGLVHWPRPWDMEE